MIKHTISRDDAWYHAWPDLIRTPSGDLLCVFSECTHHNDRSHTRIVLSGSADAGKTWSPKRALSGALKRESLSDPYWNCARLALLSDGGVIAVADRISGEEAGNSQQNFLWFSKDGGISWGEPGLLPVRGLVPDKPQELRHLSRQGHWVLATHTVEMVGDIPVWCVQCWISEDRGVNWEGPFQVAKSSRLYFCEPSILELSCGTLVCFLRENSNRGLDAFKTISRDGGRSWSEPVAFPIPACHRPVAGRLRDGKILITYRMKQGGKRVWGGGQQNFLAALTDEASCLASSREEASVRIFPIDYDRSPNADTGYSGWVEMPDGSLYIATYIVDDAPLGQIRGYSIPREEILLH